jgi:uncharacterized protein involved in exopolysaccharide biosynthesis
MVPTIVAVALCCLPPSFVSSAKVLIRIEEQGTPSFFAGIAAFRESTTPEPANRKLETELELVDVWPNAADVVKRLGLTYDRVYHPPWTHLMDPLVDIYEFFMVRCFGVQATRDRRGFTATAIALQHAIAVAPLASKSAETTSNIIEVTLRGVDPASTQKSLSELLDVYQNSDMRQQREASQRAYNIVAEETERAKAVVLAAQHQLETFMAQHRVVRASVSNGPITQVNSAQAPSGSRDESTAGAIRIQLLKREIELGDMERDSPGRVGEIEALRGSIADLNLRLDREVKRNAENEAQLLEMQRALHLAEAEYIELDKRLGQISLFRQVTASALPSRTVVEPPLLPTSSEWRRKVVIGVLSGFTGLALGVGLAGLRQFGDHRIETEADAARYLGAPVVASFPLATPEQVEQSASSLSRAETTMTGRHAHA